MELDSCKEQWNSHYIRKSEFCEVFGRPDYLYNFPRGNSLKKGTPIVQEDVDLISDYITDYNNENNEDDSIFVEYCDYVFQELTLPLCSNFEVAKENFLRLLELNEN